MNQPPVISRSISHVRRSGRRLVAGPTVMGSMIGMTQADIGGRAIETSQYSDVRHAAPVFHGGTLCVVAVILEGEELPGGGGTVTVEARGHEPAERSGADVVAENCFAGEAGRRD